MTPIRDPLRVGLVLTLLVPVATSGGCQALNDDDLETRVAATEARLDDAEADLAAAQAALADARADADELAGTVSVLAGHPMMMIEDVGAYPSVAEAVCPDATVLVGGGCACPGSQVTRSVPAHVGCTVDDESCVRSWICDCASGAGTARALCATLPPET
jgi:hypothetical protein